MSIALAKKFGLEQEVNKRNNVFSPKVWQVILHTLNRRTEYEFDINKSSKNLVNGDNNMEHFLTCYNKLDLNRTMIFRGLIW